MLEIDKLSKKFDLIVDIFSSYNLNLKENEKLIKLIHKKLKNKGTFFCYTPGKNSTSWKKEKDKFHHKIYYIFFLECILPSYLLYVYSF